MNNVIMFSLIAFNLVFIGIFFYHAIFTINQRVRIDIVEADLEDLESEVVGKLSADVAIMKDDLAMLMAYNFEDETATYKGKTFQSPCLKDRVSSLEETVFGGGGLINDMQLRLTGIENKEVSKVKSLAKPKALLKSLAKITTHNKLVLKASSLTKQIGDGCIVFSGGKMKAFRQTKKIKQAELGKKIGCSGSYIGYIENNKTKKVNIKTIFKIARILKIQPIDLFKPAQQKGESK